MIWKPAQVPGSKTGHNKRAYFVRLYHAFMPEVTKIKVASPSHVPLFLLKSSLNRELYFQNSL